MCRYQTEYLKPIDVEKGNGLARCTGRCGRKQQRARKDTGVNTVNRSPTDYVCVGVWLGAQNWLRASIQQVNGLHESTHAHTHTYTHTGHSGSFFFMRNGKTRRGGRQVCLSNAYGLATPVGVYSSLIDLC